MTETATLPQTSRPELVEFRKQDAAIAKLREQYMPLKINGLEDKEGFAKVHDARMIVKNTRVSVEKKRVELKADALAYGRAVDAEAKRLTELLAPIESHLEAEEDCIVQERERIKKEAERKRQAITQDRVDKFMALGVVPSIIDVAVLTDEQFAESLAAAQKAKDERDAAAEAQRKAEEKARREKEEAEAAEAERIKAEQERPQRQKIAGIADHLEAIAVPVGPGSGDVKAVLVKAAADIRTISKRRSLGGK